VQRWLMNDEIDSLQVSQELTNVLYEDMEGWPRPSMGLGVTLLAYDNQVQQQANSCYNNCLLLLLQLYYSFFQMTIHVIAKEVDESSEEDDEDEDEEEE